MPADANELLTVPEAAQVADRKSQTIRRWIYSGFLKAQKGGGKYGRFRIYRSELMKAIEYDPETRDDT